MHRRAEYSGILVTLDSLTPGKQQQPPAKTKDEAQERKRVKRPIRLSKEEEAE